MTHSHDEHETEHSDADAPQEFKYRFKYLHKYGDQTAPASDGDEAEEPSEKGAAHDPDEDGDRHSGSRDATDNDEEDGKKKSKDKAGKDGKDDGKDDGEEEQSPEEKRKQKRKKIIVLASIAAVFILAGITWLLLYLFVFSQRETTDDAYIKGDMVTISSRVAGTVVAITAEETDRVHAGQVLVRLDPADAQVSLMNARGKLAQAVRQAQQSIQDAAEADAVVAQRRAQYESQRDDYNRRHPLLAQHAVASEAVSNSRRQMQAAYAALQQAERAAASAHAQVDGTTVRNVPTVIQARAAFRNAWINNGRDAIVSPIDGYVAKRQVQVGQRVQPGQSMLVVVPLSNLWIDANFKETQLAHIRIGQPAKIDTDMYSDFTFHGYVVGLGAGTGSAFSLLPAENATGNWIKVVQRLPVRIAIDPDDLHKHPLRVGLSADVNVDTHDRNGRVLSDVTREKPLSSTAVYQQEASQADAHAEAIIRANLVPELPAATPLPGKAHRH